MDGSRTLRRQWQERQYDIEAERKDLGEWLPLASAYGDNMVWFKEEGISNARLIAAAPDLLAACILVTDSEFYSDCVGASVANQMRAAIAKAKGEQK